MVDKISQLAQLAEKKRYLTFPESADMFRHKKFKIGWNTVVPPNSRLIGSKKPPGIRKSGNYKFRELGPTTVSFRLQYPNLISPLSKIFAILTSKIVKSSGVNYWSSVQNCKSKKFHNQTLKKKWRKNRVFKIIWTCYDLIILYSKGIKSSLMH